MNTTRKILISILVGLWVLIIVIVMVGVTKNRQAAAQNSGQNTQIASTQTATTPNVQQPTENQSVNVDKGLLNVKITLPKSMFKDTDINQTIQEAKAKGISDVKINDDGSLTYTMSKKLHSQMLDEMRTSIAEILEQAKGEEYPSIKDVSYNDNFTKISLTVDRQSYENGFDGFITIGIGIGGMYYQAFAGMNDFDVTIDIIDNATSQVFNTVKYPDVLEKEN